MWVTGAAISREFRAPARSATAGHRRLTVVASKAVVEAVAAAGAASAGGSAWVVEAIAVVPKVKLRKLAATG